MKKLVFLSFYLLTSVFCAYADTGCVMNYNHPDERVFVTLSGTAGSSNYPNYINGVGNDQSPSAPCPKYDYYSAFIIYRGTPATPVRCCISGNCDISYVLMEFQLLECPFDAHLFIAAIPIMLFGLCSLKKKLNYRT